MLFFSQNWTKCLGQDLEVGIRNADLKKANFSNISALLPVCIAVYSRYMQSIIRTYYFYSLTFIVATNKYYMHSAKNE